jgi:hypothetical protein
MLAAYVVKVKVQKLLLIQQRISGCANKQNLENKAAFSVEIPGSL